MKNQELKTLKDLNENFYLKKLLGLYDLDVSLQIFIRSNTKFLQAITTLCHLFQFGKLNQKIPLIKMCFLVEYAR